MRNISPRLLHLIVIITYICNNKNDKTMNITFDVNDNEAFLAKLIEQPHTIDVEQTEDPFFKVRFTRNWKMHNVDIYAVGELCWAEIIDILQELHNEHVIGTESTVNIWEDEPKDEIFALVKYEPKKFIGYIEDINIEIHVI